MKPAIFSGQAGLYKFCFFLIAYFMVLNYLVLHTPFSFFKVEDVAPINQAYIFDSETQPTSPLDHAAQPVELPDDWHHSQRTANHYWYRQSFELSPPESTLWAVYLPSVTHNAAVYINGTWIGQGGSFEPPIARNHNQPLLFEFSSQLLKSGQNFVEVHVAASHPRQGLMDEFYIAPVDKLYASYRWKQFIRVDLIESFTLIMYVMAIILFCFWLARPQDKIYGLFSLLLTIWASHNLNLFIVHIPTSAHFWEAMTMSTLGWTVVTMIFFNHRYVGHGNQNIERVILIFAVLGMGIFFLPDIGSILVFGYGVWDAFLIIFGSYAIIYLIRTYWVERELDIFLMLLVGIPILVFGFHDILTVNNFRDRREGLIIQYSVIPAVLLFNFFLIRRFVKSINQAEQLTASLELRVQQREKELHEQFAKVSHLEQQRILSNERERIMRDMHDGIGGQLVAVITELGEQQDTLSNRIRKRIQHSLTDLRMVIDSMDPLLNDLSTLLGMMRARLEEQLNAAGIKLVWGGSDVPEMNNLSPTRNLHVMRIVQEVVTNAIKHSQASCMTISISTDDGFAKTVIIKLEDNGVGIKDSEITSTSRGIKNMQYRAKQLDSELHISSNTDGTSIMLVIPIDQH